MTTTLRIDPKKKTFSMSAIARLLHYISHNDAAGVQTEISNGADVNHAEPVRRPPNRWRPGVLMAVRFGWQPTGKTALHFAAEQDARGPGEGNTVKIIQLLLDVRPHFRRPSFPAHTLRLSERAGAGGQAGSTVDARDNQGNTPLQLTHNVGVAKALLRAGADTACVNHVRMQTPRTISRVVPPYPAGCGLVRPGRGDGAGETKATRRQ